MSTIKVKATEIPGYEWKCPQCGVRYTNSSAGVVTQNAYVHTEAKHPTFAERFSAKPIKKGERKKRYDKAKTERGKDSTKKHTRRLHRVRGPSDLVRNPHPTEPKTPELTVNA